MASAVSTNMSSMGGEGRVWESCWASQTSPSSKSIRTAPERIVESVSVKAGAETGLWGGGRRMELEGRREDGRQETAGKGGRSGKRGAGNGRERGRSRSTSGAIPHLLLRFATSA